MAHVKYKRISHNLCELQVTTEMSKIETYFDKFEFNT